MKSAPNGVARRRRRPRPAAVVVTAFDSDPLAALDKAAALLNRAIGSSTESKQQQKSKKGDSSQKPTKKRWVSFSATATSAVAIAPLLLEAAARDRQAREKGESKGREGSGGGDRQRIPGRDLLAYLALPASEYSLLDPAWVTREGEEESEGEEEAENDDGGDGVYGDDISPSSFSSPSSSAESFIVRFPLSDLVGIPLTPSFRVRVKSRSPKEGLVAFAADKAALGDPTLDSSFEAGVDATLSRKKTKNAFGGSKRSRKSKKKKHAAVYASAAVGNGRGEAAAETEEHEHHHHEEKNFFSEDDASSSLSAHVTVKARVQLSGAAAALPGPLVSLAAKLVSRAVLAASLSPFLNLLVNDYWAWSVGLDRSALVKFDDEQKQMLRLQVAQATTEMVERREEEEREMRLREREEAARGEGEVIEL